MLKTANNINTLVNSSLREKGSLTEKVKENNDRINMTLKFGAFAFGVILAVLGPQVVLTHVLKLVDQAPSLPEDALKAATFDDSNTDPLEDEIFIMAERERRAIRSGSSSSANLKIGLQELTEAEVIATEVVDKMQRFESNLVHNTRLPLGSPSYVAMLESQGDAVAQELAKKAFVSSKATAYLRDRHCLKYGENWAECLKRIQSLARESSSGSASPSSNLNELPCHKAEYRTVTGRCNNDEHSNWGAVHTAYSRILPAVYSDGVWEPRRLSGVKDKSNPLTISDQLVKSEKASNPDITLALAAWANLVAQDLAHTASYAMMYTGKPIMCCDNFGRTLLPRYRHPLCMNLASPNQEHCMNYVRSMLVGRDDSMIPEAEQMNTATHFLDASNIYGATQESANQIREWVGGRIKLETPEGKRETMTCGDGTCVVSADMRTNLGPLNALMNTVLIREHNRVADKLAVLNPDWDDWTLYEEAKRIIVAEIQVITYNEWLPLVVGAREVATRPALRNTIAYDPSTDPSVSNSFANAAMSFVASVTADHLNLYNQDGEVTGSMPLRSVPVEISVLEDQVKMASIARGMTTQRCQATDLIFSDSELKYKYSKNNKTSLNGLALDIQRGRDHGLPPYASFRKYYGLPHRKFGDLLHEIPVKTMRTLMAAYDSLADVDLFVGGMAEEPVNGGVVGPVFAKIIASQMESTRKADRYFFDNPDQAKPFSKDQVHQLKKASLARLLCDNLKAMDMVQPFAFHAPNKKNNKLVSCHDETEIKRVNLNSFKA